MLIAFALAILSVVEIGPPGLLASCAWVRAENDATGTAFVVDTQKRLLITCRHLVGDHAKVDVYFPWMQVGALVSDRRLSLAERFRLRKLGLLVTAAVVRKSDELDLALLRAESLPRGTRAVKLGVAPSAGEPLSTIGNRLDLETVWNVTSGPVRARGRLADGYFWHGKKLAENAEVLVGQLPIEEGDSGGPVVDSRGRVVGMVAALRRQSPLAAVVISSAEIQRFAALPQLAAAEKVESSRPAEQLQRATVWITPTATDRRPAGVLIERDLVLTDGRSLMMGDCVGIALPIRENGRWVADRAAYRDPVELALKGHWRRGRVIARDTDRDLTLIRLEGPVEGLPPLPIAAHSPEVGESVHTMNHPGGLEFAWVYASGVIRQRGRVAVAGEAGQRVAVLLCQLPAQAGSSGGGVLNDRGEVVGLLTAKEAAQMVAYAVAAGEIVEFLDGAHHDRPARTATGLRGRAGAIADSFLAGLSQELSGRADEHWRAGQLDAARQEAQAAIALDPGSVRARLCRAEMLLAESRADVAMGELDLAVEKGPFDRAVLLRRSEVAGILKDWRKARGDLERILAVDPVDAGTRHRLAEVYLELGDQAKAASAISDTLRANPKRLAAIARSLLVQADRFEKKYPDAPSIAVGWLQRALAAVKCKEVVELLRRVGSANTDRERLVLLREGLAVIAER